MTFQKKDWQFRDVISEDELNRIEDGIEEGITKAEQAKQTADNAQATADEANQKAEQAQQTAQQAEQTAQQAAQTATQTANDLASHQADYASFKNITETEIDDLKSSVSNGKNAIASAITDMGQNASGSDSFSTLANKIKDISKDATAEVGDVLSGKTFYQGGLKRTGNMPNRGAVVITPSTTNQAIAAGYHNGNGYVKGDPNLIASNIRSGINIFGVIGSLIEGRKFASGTAVTEKSGGYNQITVRGLAFRPGLILVCFPNSIEIDTQFVLFVDSSKYPIQREKNIRSSVVSSNTVNLPYPCTIYDDGFTIESTTKVGAPNAWIALS